jgi:DNA polymerase III delta prime subunit
MTFNFFRPVIQENHATQLFTVKYAPKRLENIAGNSEIIRTLIKYRQEQNMPNLIIAGPPGCAKKTAVHLLAKSFLGLHFEEAHYLVEGAIERGKHMVTEVNLQNKKKPNDNNIISFLKLKTNLPPGKFKIITILDFDHMTNDAQMALRRIIEKHADRARFIFVANDHQDIIEAIQSRCVIMKFSPLSGPEMLPVLDWIMQRESQIKFKSDLLELIILAAYGDLKQALIYLQIMLNAVQDNSEVFVETNSKESSISQKFYEIFGLPQLPRLKKLLRNPDYQQLQDLLDDGFTATDLLDILTKVVLLNTFQLSNAKQQIYLEAIAKAAYYSDCTGTNHHMYAMIADFGL